MKTYKPAVTGSRLTLEFLLVATALVLAACTGQTGAVLSTISVQVAPATANIGTNQTQQFTATVTGTTNTAVTWQVSSSSASAASIGTVNSSGLYTAPGTVPTGGTVTITATSQADSTKSGTAVVTVTAPPAVTVTVSPKTATVTTGLTQQFSASVTNTSNTAVSWQVNGVTGGGATTGTISATGLYTAPATVPSGTVTVKAISVADNTKSDTAAVTITAAPVISVTVSPTTASVQAGSTKQFTATVANTSNTAVTWQVNSVTGGNSTVGTISATGLYTAPATVPASNPVTVKAVSAADNTRSDTAAVTVTAGVSVAVSPKTASVVTSQTQQFTATVSNTSNTAVTWQVNSVTGGSAATGTISATGLYTAPATVPSGAVTVRAISVADSTQSDTAAVTVTLPVSVTVSPKTPSAQVGQTQQFTATVANTSNTAVTWQVNSVTGGSSTTGTISATGLFTAPATVPASNPVTVTAISVADSTKSDSTTVTITAAPVVSITLAPTTANVQAGIGKQNFTATLANDATSKGVTWSVSGTGCSGATCGTLTNVTTTSVTYNAPPSVPSPAAVTLKATSIADATRTSSAAITLSAPVGVSVLPTSATINVSKTQNFTATVTNDSQNKGVTWTLTGTGCTGTACGTLSASSSASGAAITYTAPATAPSPATVTLKATSVTDASRAASATITIAPAIGVTVAPTTANVTVSLTQNFTATVTNDAQNKGVTWALSGAGCSGTTCGVLSTSSSASGVAITYTAPATVPSPATVTLTATSVADNTKSDTATVTITPAPTVTVTITPKRGGLTPGQTMTFTPTVTGSSNTAVTWEVDGVTGGSSTVGAITTGGVYAAPNSGGVHNIVARSVADTTATSAASPIGVTDLSGVATYHNDLSRNGANTREFALTTANVAKATFGKLFACPVDAAVYAQPLWVPNLTISGAQHNVIIAVTQHDSIYAFDADASPCVTLWSKVGTSTGSLIPAGETWVVSGATGSVDVPCADLAPAIGIVGTPVVDLATNTIYLVTKTKTISPVAFHQRLHALDITTGAEKFGGPVEISASIRSATFTALKNNQRPGLALVNGNVYIGWSSHCDEGAYQGFLMAYSASTLSQVATFTPAPNAVTSIESGIWMSGGAPAADSSNNLYLITGNGTFNADHTSAPNDDYGDSLLKLGTTGGISVLDYFTPHNQSTEQSSDADLGSGGAAILVDQPGGPVQHLVIGGGKDGILFLLNRDNLGKFTATDSGPIQLLNIGDAIYATPAFWNNRLYIGGVFGGSHVQAFTFNPGTGMFTSPSSSQSPTSYGFPGATPSVSANGTSQGIVWAIDSSKNGTDGSSFGAAVLHAYDATNLATELWNSAQVAGDAAGVAVKFTVPTVANGKVYIGTQGEISAYGLKPQ